MEVEGSWCCVSSAERAAAARRSSAEVGFGGVGGGGEAAAAVGGGEEGWMASGRGGWGSVIVFFFSFFFWGRVLGFVVRDFLGLDFEGCVDGRIRNLRGLALCSPPAPVTEGCKNNLCGVLIYMVSSGLLTLIPIQLRFTFPSGCWMDSFEQPFDRSAFRSPPFFSPSTRILA